ncbi:MAG: BrnT family toxin [Pseudomonadota bacterium]
MKVKKVNFEWDDKKDYQNRMKHGVSFSEAQKAFLDTNRIIAEDLDHSSYEKRYYCFGKVYEAVMTVRFTYRASKIRLIGAGYWRKGKRIYEQAQKS